MALIKDKIVEWFIKYRILPKISILDIPGFVIWRTPHSNREVRELFFPEGILVVLELKLRKRLAYTIGKKFGKFLVN